MLRRYLMSPICTTNLCARFLSTKPQEGLNSKQLLLKLRNKTGYPLISCKQALKATAYDIGQAEEYLIKVAKEKGWDKMQDISGKSMGQGLIAVAISSTKASAAIIEVNCATDFVAKTTEFQTLVKDAAEVALTNFSKDCATKMSVAGGDLLKLTIPGKETTLQEETALMIGKLKENILVRRASVLSPPSGACIASYIHPTVLVSATRPGSMLGMYAAIASITCTSSEKSSLYIRSKGRDICQHIVGMRPDCIGEKTEYTPDETTVNATPQQARDGADEQEETDDNERFAPPDENSSELLKQPFLLDSDISVEQWLDLCDLEIHDYIRFQVGEAK